MPNDLIRLDVAALKALYLKAQEARRVLQAGQNVMWRSKSDAMRKLEVEAERTLRHYDEEMHFETPALLAAAETLERVREWAFSVVERIGDTPADREEDGLLDAAAHVLAMLKE